MSMSRKKPRSAAVMASQAAVQASQQQAAHVAARQQAAQQLTAAQQVPMVPRPPTFLATASQSSSQIKTDDSNNKSLLGLLLLLGALGIGTYAWLSETQEQSTRQTASQDVQDPVNRAKLENQVNRHVQSTNRQMEIEKEQIKMEATFNIPKVGQFVVQKDKVQKFDLSGDTVEMNAARDLEGQRGVAMSANDIIQGELVRQSQGGSPAVAPAIGDEEYRREYARQFIENARRNGYEVTLSPDLKVIGVQELPRGEAYR
jgi:hypothetical protein